MKNIIRWFKSRRLAHLIKEETRLSQDGVVSMDLADKIYNLRKELGYI